MVDADVVEPIEQYLNNPELKDPNVNFEDFIPRPTEASTMFDGQRIGFPKWPYNYICWGRKDFLTNPDEKAAFEEEYSYPLALPETMDQMHDIAEFFTRDAGENLAGETLSEPMYGFVQEGARLSVPCSPIYWLYMRQYGGGWFNEDGTPNFSRPENVEAMEFYKSLWEFSPPGRDRVLADRHPGRDGGGASCLWPRLERLRVLDRQARRIAPRGQLRLRAAAGRRRRRQPGDARRSRM